MITIHDIQTIEGQRQTLQIDSWQEIDLDASDLILLPGAIDPHVHFRVPGQDYKEDWTHAARATIHGGYTCVFDMPNNIPACTSLEQLTAKKALIESQLAAGGVPLRYELYIGADRNHFDQIHLVKDQVIGMKIFMGSSTGDLLMDDDSSLHGAFAIAGRHKLVVAVHAEEEEMIQARLKQFGGRTDFLAHSEIRTPEVAAKAVEKALFLAKMYDVTLYILHVSTADELALIAKAKAEGIRVFAETTPHHLFLSTDDYPRLNGRGQMNPPLREAKHHAALWQGIADGTIDTLGSDHAPHTKGEKCGCYGEVPSGVPGIETNLPLLLNAVNQGKLSLARVADLTHHNVRRLFNFQHDGFYTLVNLKTQKPVDESSLYTKCGWSPFADMPLTGWPSHVILRDQLITIAQ